MIIDHWLSRIKNYTAHGKAWKNNFLGIQLEKLLFKFNGEGSFEIYCMIARTRLYHTDITVRGHFSELEERSKILDVHQTRRGTTLEP